MIEFQEPQFSQDNSAGLKRVELDALLAVQDEYLSEYYSSISAKFGSCILDCQPLMKKTECIARYNLCGGSYNRRFFRSYIRSSDEMAANSIDELLDCANPKSRFYQQFERITEALNTGIYQDGELLVMVLDAYGGSFLFAPNVSLNGEMPSYEVSIGLMYATAEALAIIGREDYQLNKSVIALIQESAYTDYAGEAVTAVNVARRCFGHDTKVAEIRTWREWRNRSGYHKKARVFFE